MKDTTFKDLTAFAVLVVGLVGLVTCQRLVAPLVGAAQALQRPVGVSEDTRVLPSFPCRLTRPALRLARLGAAHERRLATLGQPAAPALPSRRQ